MGMKQFFFIAFLALLLSVRAAPLSIGTEGAALSLAWDGEHRVIYDIEYSFDLENWTNSAASRTGDRAGIQLPVSEVLENPNEETAFFRLQTHFQDNEDGAVQDMLTPAYYNTSAGDAFREEINTFIYYSQREILHHPLQNGTNTPPSFTVPSIGYFGAGKGPGGTAEHHPAADIHVGSSETAVDLFAAHGGTVATFKNIINKYRHHLSISKALTNDTGQVIGKLVTVYAHIDLDMDEADGLFVDGQTVSSGDLISKNLYSGTAGGPHLHFEIRYYKPTDTGDEEFYGFTFTDSSAGPWSYGKWDPNVGYGFGDPKNHGLVFY